MDVHVGQMNSTVRVGDGAAAGPGSASFERLVEAVVARVRRELSREKRIDDDRELRPATSAREATSWETT